MRTLVLWDIACIGHVHICQLTIGRVFCISMRTGQKLISKESTTERAYTFPDDPFCIKKFKTA